LFTVTSHEYAQQVLTDNLRFSIIAGLRRNTRDDLISQLVRAEVDGHRLSDDEIYPLPAAAPPGRGGDDLPVGWQPAVRPAQPPRPAGRRPRRPEAGAAGDRGSAAVGDPAADHRSMATEDLELGGVSIPEGALVAVSLGAANRDPGRYADPDAFDIFRDPTQHISFGDGPHRCLGMHLARLEMQVLLNTVLDRLPHLRLDPASRRRRGAAGSGHRGTRPRRAAGLTVALPDRTDSALILSRTNDGYSSRIPSSLGLPWQDRADSWHRPGVEQNSGIVSSRCDTPGHGYFYPARIHLP
jgi:hypothetical protein